MPKIHIKPLRALRLCLMGGGASLALASAALAQTGETLASNTLEEVTVTAQKRAENVQNVPLSVTPVTAATIERLHIQDLKDVTGAIPNVQINVNAGAGLAASLVVRGIGIANNPSPFVGTEVGTVIDGVVQATNTIGLADQFDVERIEVLRGPQGTLFGANTTGGVVNIIMRQPTGVFGGYGKITAGNYHRLDGSMAVNFPIVEGVLAGKVAISHRGRDGFYTNLYNGEDISHINSTRLRGYLLWTPDDDLRVSLVSELQRIRNGTDVLHPLSYPGQVFYRPNTPVDYDVYIDVPDQNHVNASSHTLTADWNAGSGQVTSITNYSQWTRHAVQDVDGINCFCFASFSQDYGWQMSQELRDVFHPADNLEILIGGFAQAWAYGSNNISVAAFASPTAFGRTRINQRSENLAAFTQAYWDVTDKLRVQGGLRVSYETVRLYRANIAYNRPAGTSSTQGFGNLVGAVQLPISTTNFPSQGRETWTNLGGKIGLDYQVSEDMLTYAYYARGFKSGGFNGRVTLAHDIGPYDPEFVNSFEMGMKSDWMDNRLRLNVAAFLNKWEDMQVTQSVYRGTPPVAASVILNAGKSTTKGLEFEGEFVLVEGLRLNASLGYLKAKYDDFRSGTGATCPPLPAAQPAGCSVDYSGRPLMYSPKWNGSLGANYTFAMAGGEASAMVQYTYTGAKWGNYTQSPSERLPAVSLVNAALSWSPPKADWTVSAWGRNVFDKRYVAMALDVPPLFTEGVIGNPRQFGIDFDFKF